VVVLQALLLALDRPKPKDPSILILDGFIQLGWKVQHSYFLPERFVWCNEWAEKHFRLGFNPQNEEVTNETNEIGRLKCLECGGSSLFLLNEAVLATFVIERQREAARWE
jgi:hypothetical protein